MTKSRKKKSNKKFHWKLYLGLAGFCLLIGLITSFIYVDALVRNRLDRPLSAESAAIYSRYEQISSDRPVDMQTVQKLLDQRGYTPANSIPKYPGEYFWTNDDRVIIYTREFYRTDGTVEPASLDQIDFKTFQITSKARKVPLILFEPKKISSLSGDSRINKYRALEEFPKHIKQALLATEDERFYSHFGVDVLGIMRAIIVNISKGRMAQGGSTLTQQLAKNVFFSPKRTLSRKFMEALAAISLEWHLSKDKILELYLNEVYLGQEGSIAIHGMAAASRLYFDTDVSKLNLAQAALLAGIIKAPSYYAPDRHPQRAKTRRDVVLTQMLESKTISEAEYKTAKDFPIETKESPSLKSFAPFFSQIVRTKVAADLELSEESLASVKINTGLSPELQDCAEQAIQRGLEKIEKNFPSTKRKNKPLEAALVAIENYSGLIRSWVGGRDFSSNQFDHALLAKRQIGSTVKPFVYLTALDRNLNTYKVATAATLLPDEPLEIQLPNQAEPWSPNNYDNEFRGPVTLRYALEHSLNVPAVYITQKVGSEKIADTLTRFGIADRPLAVPSLALGALETSLLQLTTTYAALANNGVAITPRLFVSVTDLDNKKIGESLWQENRIADPDATAVLTNILQGAIERGTGSSIRSSGFTSVAAGKTGTTNDYRDAWFIGFTPTLTAGVWVGYDDNQKVGLTGGQVAAPIWADYLKCAEQFSRPSNFTLPAGVNFSQIDSQTGFRYDSTCQGHSISEIFVNGTEPIKSCSSTEILPPPTTPKPASNKSVWDLIFG